MVRIMLELYCFSFLVVLPKILNGWGFQKELFWIADQHFGCGTNDSSNSSSNFYS
jgi:hypothetical protein